MIQGRSSIESAFAQAQAARDSAQWEMAVHCYSELEKSLPNSFEIKHNLGISYLGWGKLNDALRCCNSALTLKPDLWQSAIIVARAHKGLGQMEAAQRGFQGVLNHEVGGAQARLGLADLAMNQFGDPLEAVNLVRPLAADSLYAVDAELTTLMASLYDRNDWNKPGNANLLSNKVKQFASKYLVLPTLTLPDFEDRSKSYKSVRYRPKVGLISPLFCVSPVYFLTIAGWQHVAKGCDLIIFNRGHKVDWATEIFKEISDQWINVQHLNAEQLAKQVRNADLDVLYDLGGWMDAVALKALSTKPARKMFKWVGGQSVTTGLTVFDGWIGDEQQSPSRLQSLYSEPLINIPAGYSTYTPPDYLPSPAKQKSKTPCIFANPAKVSRAFLRELKKIPGTKVFIHNQYRYSQVQERIQSILGQDAQFVIPKSHQEALQSLNSHATMIDTFPYSSGLTAYEALALKTQVQVLHVGELFCERHTAKLLIT